MSEDKITARITALLRKAEGTDNEHEADAFMQAAQRLSTLHQVDLETARIAAKSGQVREIPTQRTITIGERGKVGLRSYVRLFLKIGQANNLTCDIARDGTRVYAFGFASDIDVTEALYGSLSVQMARAVTAYLKAGTYKDKPVDRLKSVRTTDLFGRPMVEKQWVYESVSPRTAKVAFQEAFALKVGARLASASAAAEAEIQATSQTGAELVLVGRRDEVELLYKAKSVAKGSWKGATHSGSKDASAAGHRAGAQARLGTEPAIGGHRTQLAG